MIARLFCLVAIAVVALGCSEKQKLPVETQDYKVDMGCGCSSTISGQYDVLKVLGDANLFGQHKLAAEKPLLVVDFGSIQRIFIGWICNGESHCTELTPELVAVVVDKGIDSPTVQWKWDMYKIYKDGAKLERKKLGQFAAQYSLSVTFRLSPSQYRAENALHGIKLSGHK